ncbi:hypothetical protein Vretifemale_7302 [Volvox reticuliferus]|nr:hypothetical protein Vretifemale_7302 [Volvox reticuliferus]
MIGSNLTEGAHLHNAAMVCKSWNARIATGLTNMEVDMHSDPGMWRAKILKLQSLIRHLRCVVIHVNAAITDDMLFQNIALVQQLKGVSELKLHLREGCDLPPAAAAAIGAMPHLTSLSIIGGSLKADAAASLLSGVAASACDVVGSPGLRSLTLLPAVPHGLGDAEMEVLSACSSLEVLEFRAYRLTSAGLATLSLGLPRLTRLAITSLDSDSGYELACLERLAQLAELDLALDNAPLGAASRRALCAVKPGRSLSLSFRWTDKAQGLLTEYGNRLANLTHLDVGACRVGSESLFEAVAQLTGLRELRMAVYSNADHCIPCHLSRLSALAALQHFRLEKRRAYFPEARRFGESSIAVPVTAEGLRSLADRWSRLRSLRLALSRKDYSPEALSVLSSFTGLRDLGIVVERYPGSSSSSGAQQQQQQQQEGVPEGSGASFSHPEHAPAGSGSSGNSGNSGISFSSGGGSSCNVGHGRLYRRTVELPPVLDLAWLPPGLQSLELNNLLLDLSEPSASFTAAPPALQPLPLSQLTSLDIEACVVRQPLLPQVARRCASSLRSLRLAGVVGLCDAVLSECLTALPMLRSLRVCASGNRAVSQASLAALSGCNPSREGVARLSVTGEGSGGSANVDANAATAAWRPFPQQQQQPQQQRPLLPLLRHLMWESEDLTARGPNLSTLAPLTTLRHLYLSCTDKTAERALGSLRVLQEALPYCHVDMVWTTARPGDVP